MISRKWFWLKVSIVCALDPDKMAENAIDCNVHWNVCLWQILWKIKSD